MWSPHFDEKTLIALQEQELARHVARNRAYRPGLEAGPARPSVRGHADGGGLGVPLGAICRAAARTVRWAVNAVRKPRRS